jgi:hypothetical protein
MGSLHFHRGVLAEVDSGEIQLYNVRHVVVSFLAFVDQPLTLAMIVKGISGKIPGRFRHDE